MCERHLILKHPWVDFPDSCFKSSISVLSAAPPAVPIWPPSRENTPVFHRVPEMWASKRENLVKPPVAYEIVILSQTLVKKDFEYT